MPEFFFYIAFVIDRSPNHRTRVLYDPTSKNLSSSVTNRGLRINVTRNPSFE